MDIARRTFIKSAALVGVGSVALGGARVTAAQGPAEETGGGDADAGSAKPPVAAANHFQRATEEAVQVLQSGGSSLDAVEQGINVIERDPDTTSVGIGGIPNWEGVIELDAAIMHGPTLTCGAVAALQDIETPISVARKVMEETEHVLLAGQGAQDFALNAGFEKKELVTEEARDRWKNWKEWRQQELGHEALQDSVVQLMAQDPRHAAASFRGFRRTAGDKKAAVLLFEGVDREGASLILDQLEVEEVAGLTRTILGMDIDWVPLPRRNGLLRAFIDTLTGREPSHDTVGLIAMDDTGDLSCGVSTSGKALKLPGRVGDSPLIGAGSYVDNEVGAAVATGTGEHVIRFAGCFAIVENMRHGMSPREAGQDVVERMLRKIEDTDALFTILCRDGRYASVGTSQAPSFVCTEDGVRKMELLDLGPEW